ncbi:MAG: metallopeptidase TldD-related protein [Planctomycetota bacterium]|jgi:hypothetical protein
MIKKKTLKLFAWMGFLSALFAGAAPAVNEELPGSDVLMQALVDEMERSMDLQMEDLEQPYFIIYMADDSVNYFMAAEYGAITSFDRDRSRDFNNQVRVGSYELDNTNFSGDRGGFSFSFGGRRRRGGGGGRASLPLDDDYTAIRQAIWWATDYAYKSAVETLTKKRAYMKDKKLEDRPHDFTRADAVEHFEPPARLAFDRTEWERNLKTISGRFRKFPQIQDSGVQLTIGASNRYTANSEGTRTRTARQGAMMMVRAEVQAKDGMMISDQITFYAETLEGLPEIESILAKVDELVDDLTTAANAPIMEGYTGPVLFDGIASPQLFRELLASDIAGQVEPVGSQRSRRGGGSGGALERKLDQKILPGSFKVYDDPTIEKVGDDALLGHYTCDDEGIRAQRVDLVEKGVLKNMVLSRVPTKKMSGSNGHGRRSSGSGRLSAAIGSLFIEDAEGMAEADLKKALIEAADDQGLEYGLCVRKIKSGGMPTSQRDIMALVMGMRGGGGAGPRLGDPILIYKVYVDDGREELVRGCEFDEIKLRDLKDIVASGSEPVVYNYMGFGMRGASPATSIVAPAVLFEELELNPIEEEHDNPPILQAPLFR